jgi:hypothetical protein
MDFPKFVLDSIDVRVRKLVNRYLKRQSLQKSIIYARVKNGGLGIPCMEDDYASYKIHHMAILMSTSDGKGIFDGYLNIEKKAAKHLSLIGSRGGALNHLSIKWLDWDEYKGKRRRFE